MSRNAADAVSESINGIGRGGGPNVRLMPVAVNDFDRAIEQVSDVRFQSSVVKDGDMRRGINSTMISMSLSGRLSPRAREPNNAA
jgi:hypothetical protein